MPSLSLDVIVHKLIINLNATLVKQALRMIRLDVEEQVIIKLRCLLKKALLKKCILDSQYCFYEKGKSSNSYMY